MKGTAHQREAEIALGARSRHKAEEERRLVDPARLEETITEFIEWRAFAYWARLIVTTEVSISSKMDALLDRRCPGFLSALVRHSESHPDEREFFWLRLIEWIDDNVYRHVETEGWRHALGYYATRDARLDRVRECWRRCDDEWRRTPPKPLPTFEEWFEAAKAV